MTYRKAMLDQDMAGAKNRMDQWQLTFTLGKGKHCLHLLTTMHMDMNV